MLKEFDELIQSCKQYQGGDNTGGTSGAAAGIMASGDLQYQFYRDYIEGEIHFPPTYKYDKKSQKYDTSKKQRVPSWCDRILWKRNHSKVRLQVMGSFQDIDFSDHRPVFAQFEVTTNKISFEKTILMEEQYFQSMRFHSLHLQHDQHVSIKQH